MTFTSRYLLDPVARDLERKMVLLAGPRQVGKTTLAKNLPGGHAGYLNWDVPEDRERILARELPTSPLWVFDEFHKYRRWRNYLKGLYDVRTPEQRILVTGSGRLDAYRFGGDSLQGRYHFWRLHPLSVAELPAPRPEDLETLLALGGFPEPFLGGSEVEARRWSRDYRTRLIREDVADLERITDLGSLELLMMRLPDLVGSLLSINALREDLQVSHQTISNWLDILERLYAAFRIAPFGSPKVRAIRKAQKLYLFDWSRVSDDGARFENLVASHVLKWVHFQQDALGRDLDLRYFRDTHGREVDFVIVDQRTPVVAVECRLEDTAVNPGLHYLKSRFPAMEAWQISARGRKDYQTPDGIRVCPALPWLSTLT
jgi:predicted AAA+ superfamily ATPase